MNSNGLLVALNHIGLQREFPQIGLRGGLGRLSQTAV
jgi:hypothetical protein